LLALASQLADLVKPGGQIGLSGLLAEQAEYALAAYAPWFDLNPPEYREEWAFVGGRRRP